MLLSASGSYVIVALVAAAISYVMAHRKGLNAVGWAWASLFLIVPAMILPFVRTRRTLAPPPGISAANWHALLAYDPEIKAAGAQLALFGAPALDELRRAWEAVPNRAALPAMTADIEARWTAHAAAGLVHVETRDGVAVLRDATGRYHVGERQTADLATARIMATAVARRAHATSLASAVVGAAVLIAAMSNADLARAQTGTVAMTPPSCERYQRERPRGGPFEQLSDLFGLSIYRWEQADFGRYRDFLLACERSLPSLRGDVTPEAWDAAVAQGVAGLKEYAGYGQGRVRTRLDPDTPDYTPTFRKMSCDRFTTTSVGGWAGDGVTGKIEGSPFTVPLEYWNDEAWQALENRLLECERERGSPHATRTVVRQLIDAQRERYHWEIDRAQESERNRKMIAWAQERQRKEAEELERSRREEQARSATDPCNRVEMRRRLLQAANGMDRARYGGRRLIDLIRGRSMGLEGAPGVSCMFLGQWSSGEQGLVTITVRKNSLGDDLIEVRP